MRLPDHISLLELSAHSVSDEEAAGYLTLAERARQMGFRHEGRRRSFALGRMAARTLLAERLGCRALEVPLAVRDDGSLEVPGSPLNVSISHSGALAAAAVAPCAVGVDLEAMKRRPESLFRFILGPEEAKLRESVELPAWQQIVLFWSLKESVLKGQRTGLRMSPKALRLEIDLEDCAAVIHGERRWTSRFEMDQERALVVSWSEPSRQNALQLS